MQMRYKLMDDGYTWEEAEALLCEWAEWAADAERDRLAEESLLADDYEGPYGPRK